jgi:hypothetical protein
LWSIRFLQKQWTLMKNSVDGHKNMTDRGQSCCHWVSCGVLSNVQQKSLMSFSEHEKRLLFQFLHQATSARRALY